MIAMITPIVLDTSCYIAFLRGDVSVADRLRTASTILFPTIVVGELMTGFFVKKGSADATNQIDATNQTKSETTVRPPDDKVDQLHKFLDTPRVQLVEPGYRTAEQFGFLAAALKQAGTPIPVNDLWIAAIAKEHGCPVATLDGHFRRVPGLQIVP